VQESQGRRMFKKGIEGRKVEEVRIKDA
jgi:hypothetical protein